MERDKSLAAGHTDPHLQPAVLPEAGADAESGPDRTLGIILKLCGRTENRHHAVAQQLAYCPARVFHLTPQQIDVRARNASTSSTSAVSERLVKPTRSAKRTEITRRSRRCGAASSGSGCAAGTAKTEAVRGFSA